jgi:hypothetical protein
MLAEIFMLRLEETARVAAGGSPRIVSTSSFVPVILQAKEAAQTNR